MDVLSLRGERVCPIDLCFYYNTPYEASPLSKSKKHMKAIFICTPKHEEQNILFIELADEKFLPP